MSGDSATRRQLIEEFTAPNLVGRFLSADTLLVIARSLLVAEHYEDHRPPDDAGLFCVSCALVNRRNFDA